MYTSFLTNPRPPPTTTLPSSSLYHPSHVYPLNLPFYVYPFMITPSYFYSPSQRCSNISHMKLPRRGAQAVPPPSLVEKNSVDKHKIWCTNKVRY